MNMDRRGETEATASELMVQGRIRQRCELLAKEGRLVCKKKASFI